MNCPSCGAPLRLKGEDTHLTCDYCGKLHFPEKNEDGVQPLGEKSETLCPVCATPLEHVGLGRHRALGCEQCRGILIPMDLFIHVVHELRGDRDGVVQRPASPGELDRRTLCPSCHHAMDTHFYAGPGNVVIDSCSPCHLNWLDYGELNRVLRAPDHPHAATIDND